MPLGARHDYIVASKSAIAAAAGTAPFLLMYGSASRIIELNFVRLSNPTLTAVAYLMLCLNRYADGVDDTPPVDGTPIDLLASIMKVNPNSPAATPLFLSAYIAAPTTPTLTGALGVQRRLGQANTAAAAGTSPVDAYWHWERGQGPLLRNQFEAFGCAFGAAPGSAVSLGIEIGFSEYVTL